MNYSIRIFVAALLLSPFNSFAKCDLAEAAWKLNVKKVAKMLDAGAEVNCAWVAASSYQYGDFRVTPLQAALEHFGSTKKKKVRDAQLIAQEIMSYKPDLEFTLGGGYRRRTSLGFAINRYSVQSDAAIKKLFLSLIEEMILGGANINADKLIMAPLHMAACNGNLNIVKLLVENGADVLHLDSDDKLASVAADDCSPASNNIGEIKDYLSTYEVVAKEERQQEKQQAKRSGDRETRREDIQNRTVKDAALPLQLRFDKYFVALNNHLVDENFNSALVYMALIEKLNLAVPNDFYFFYGEAHLKLGETQEAINRFYQYVNLAGRDGKFYQTSLQLVSEAELDL